MHQQTQRYIRTTPTTTCNFQSSTICSPEGSYFSRAVVYRANFTLLDGTTRHYRDDFGGRYSQHRNSFRSKDKEIFTSLSRFFLETAWPPRRNAQRQVDYCRNNVTISFGAPSFPALLLWKTTHPQTNRSIHQQEIQFILLLSPDVCTFDKLQASDL